MDKVVTKLAKVDLAVALAEKAGLSKSKAVTIIDDLFDILQDKLVSSSAGVDAVTITIKNFGVFHSKRSAERIGRNPHSGEEIKIPAGRRVTFKAAKSFKQSIREV